MGLNVPLKPSVEELHLVLKATICNSFCLYGRTLPSFIATGEPKCFWSKGDIWWQRGPMNDCRHRDKEQRRFVWPVGHLLHLWLTHPPDWSPLQHRPSAVCLWSLVPGHPRVPRVHEGGGCITTPLTLIGAAWWNTGNPPALWDGGVVPPSCIKPKCQLIELQNSCWLMRSSSGALTQ